LSPPPEEAKTFDFDATQIAAVRRVVEQFAVAAGLRGLRVTDLVLAAHEVVTNSIRHAGGRGTLRLWHDDRRIACEVSDPGRIEHSLVGRELPNAEQPGGRGLWMANRLCDLVQVRTFEHGNVVRLLMHLD
jgi:anti-sigma regulatory factor (Ser/Thr protein kinase)